MDGCITEPAQITPALSAHPAGVPVGGGAGYGPRDRRQRSPWRIATLPVTSR